MNGSTGALLTSFLVVGWPRQGLVSRHAQAFLRAFTGGGTIEDRLSHLIRAVGGAGTGLRLNRCQPLELEEAARLEVEAAITSLIDKVEEVGARGSGTERHGSLSSRAGCVRSRRTLVAMRDGGMTSQAIADALNGDDVPTVRAGREWRPSSVRSALISRRAELLAQTAGQSGRSVSLAGLSVNQPLPFGSLGRPRCIPPEWDIGRLFGFGAWRHGSTDA
jgi:hypothetical protein